jgi:iron complex transport system ATP-binding protein
MSGIEQSLRASSGSVIELRDATVVLGGTRVLDGLTLTIGAGQHTAILGPNGSGKSTLMKLLALELYPVVLPGTNDVPPVRVFGKDRWDVFELRSRLGIVSADLHDRFVQGNSNGAITARDAALSGFFASQGVFGHQQVTEEMRRAAGEALVRMGVGHLAGVTLDRMSTGEARRVVIARALVRRPEALMLDEPTRGLDVVARHGFLERIRAVAQGGTTLVVVTHHANEIIPEIDRVILLNGGRILCDGAKASVLTDATISRAYGVPLAVEAIDGYYRVRVRPDTREP